MKRLVAAIPFALACAAPPALAQVGWYAGATFGQSRTSRDLVANRESTVTNVLDVHSDFDARERAAKATIGYRFRWPVAIEVNYADLGEHRVTSHFLGGDPPLPAAFTLVREVTGVGADVVVSLPVGSGATVFGRGGAVRVRLRASAELDGNIVFTNGDPLERRRTAVQDETIGRFGVGIQWPLTPEAWVRVEWERYLDIGKAFRVGGTGTTGEADTDTILAGFVFRF